MKTVAFFVLGYFVLVVGIVYFDYRYRLRRARKKRETGRIEKEKGL